MSMTMNPPPKTYSASLLSAVEAVYGCRLSSVGERMQSTACSPLAFQKVAGVGATSPSIPAPLDAFAI